MSLASSERSIKRELFEQAKKEKELEAQKLNEEKELERQKKEEEEVKKFRQQCHFKATPIKRYKSTLGTVEEKKLTVPIAPKLTTKERADFKSNLDIDMQKSD